MPIQSQFASKCYDCGKSYKIGDQIDTNGNKSSKGKDHWCIDGKNCQGVMSTQGSPRPAEKPQDPKPDVLLALEAT